MGGTKLGRKPRNEMICGVYLLVAVFGGLMLVANTPPVAEFFALVTILAILVQVTFISKRC